MNKIKNPNAILISFNGKRFEVKRKTQSALSIDNAVIKIAKSRRKPTAAECRVVRNYLQAEGFFR
jgi:hypothetical protein